MNILPQLSLANEPWLFTDLINLMNKGRINTRHMLLTNYGGLAYFIAVYALRTCALTILTRYSFSYKASQCKCIFTVHFHALTQMQS